MRVELIYAPGCHTFSKTRSALEAVIADEGLPIPIELVESDGSVDGSPTVRIDGEDSRTHHPDKLRDLLCRRWRELTFSPLLGQY